MARQEKITPQEAVEAVIGLVNMINKEQLNKLNKLDEIDGLKTRLDDVESSVRAFDATLSQPVKVEDPTLIEEGQITRNHCIRYSYIYAKNSYKLLKEIEAAISDIKVELKEIKSQLDELKQPWWRKLYGSLPIGFKNAIN